MTNEQEEVLSFELNETLYFESGQEVSEMIGISLDPEISIQSYNEYVSIRGVIELHGEYEKDQTALDKERPVDFNEYHSKRFLEKVEDGVDGNAQFSHRFPVEISVPKYRIIDTDNIAVSVESFDYELPKQNELRITSMIHIHGISNQKNDHFGTGSEDENDPLEERETIDPSEEESFAFELKEDDLDDQMSDENAELEPSMAESDNDIEDRWKYKESQTLKEFLDKDSKKDETVQTNIVEKETEEIIDTTDSSKSNDELDDQFEKETQDESEEKQEVNFLAKLFREDEEEEEKYSKMRICIVQENDTLETIAERYEVPKLQLLKQNRLEDDDLSEGQLLSIPEKKVGK